jgi:hypothetical protein
MNLNFYFDRGGILKFWFTYAVFDGIKIFNSVLLLFVSEQYQVLISRIKKVAAYFFNIDLVIMSPIQEVVDYNVCFFSSYLSQLVSLLSEET